MKNFSSTLLKALIVLFPLFLLPVTQEFYLTNKLYLLTFGILVIAVLLVLQLFLNKKINIKRSALDLPLVIFLVVNAVSIVVSSPNKIQAVLNPVTGLLPVLVFTALYFLLKRQSF
ncbi:hypothetical protein HY041_02475 [Candidatus Roizmanbacteria bacterium]|nr:hypothetical protein [Candidatus Roizmanbacteria bacterium]